MIHADIRPRLHAYIVGILDNLKSPSLQTGGVSDHVHSLFQAGYGAFSVSESQAETVIRYIKNQEHHHRKTTFQEEFREFLKRYKVAYDERYVWD